MNISIVIPAYNECENIIITIQDLLSIINKIPDVNNFEIVIVDDHSSDGTFDAIKKMKDYRIKYLRLSRRCGSHIALRAGIKEAIGDVVLCISADGQDDPSCLKDMLEKWRNDTNVVWALRKDRHIESWHMRIFTYLFYKILCWLSDAEYRNVGFNRADFFLLDRKVINAVSSYFEKNAPLFGLIACSGFKQDFVEYTRRPRRYGQSKWSLRNRLNLAENWIIAFSSLPLRLVSIIGFFVTLVGFLYGLYLLINATTGNPIPNWAPIVSGIFILGGIQMIMLGIIGIYLWHNLGESRRRPLYFIEADSRNVPL